VRSRTAQPLRVLAVSCRGRAAELLAHSGIDAGEIAAMRSVLGPGESRRL
jgi:hypothetical protein